MDDPIQDITSVVHRLTQGSPKLQEATINEYFTPDASFTHPFCRTSSFEGSRLLIHAIFRWYKILSPKIDISVNSVAYDETNLILYVSISQLFAIWFIPFHRSPVHLTTVLHLTQNPSTRKYLITSQEDFYQTNEFVKFFAPWGIGATFVLLWQFVATFFCVIGAFLGVPFTRGMQWWLDKRTEMNANGDKLVSGGGKANGRGAVQAVKAD